MTPTSSSARAGLDRAATQLAEAARGIARAGIGARDAAGSSSGTREVVRLSSETRHGADLVGYSLRSIEGALSYRANLRLIAAEDERLGQTLDVLG